MVEVVIDKKSETEPHDNLSLDPPQFLSLNQQVSSWSWFWEVHILSRKNLKVMVMMSNFAVVNLFASTIWAVEVELGFF